MSTTLATEVEERPDPAAVEEARRERCAFLEGRLRALAAEIAAAQAEFVGLVAEFDRLEGWSGYRSASDWLSNHCGHASATARKELALGHAMESLPVLRQTMARGALSLDKAAAVASLASADSETALIELALETTANQLARVTAAARRAIDPEADDDQARTQRRNRFLHTWWGDDGMLDIRGRLPAEEGAVFRKALEKAVDILRREAKAAGFEDDPPAPGVVEELVDPLAGAVDPNGAAQADGLGLMASQFLDSEPVGHGGDHYLVVIHVDAGSLDLVDDGEGRCHIEDGPALPVDLARRLCCQSSLVWLIENRDGTPVATTEKTQDIPAAVRRAVKARDGGCIFPNGIGGTCGRPAAWSHVHHVHHRAKGGPHTTANCFTLCSFHHHLVHEGGYSMVIGPDGLPEFFRPDGRPVPNLRAKLFDDQPPPPRTPRDVEPDVSWARSNGEHMDLSDVVDAVLSMTGHSADAPPTPTDRPGWLPADDPGWPPGDPWDDE